MTISGSEYSQNPDANAHIPVMDYEGSNYRSDFWINSGREYEDAVERVALRQLLPPQGNRLAEIGAGFGRLGDLYSGYKQVLLFDYSRTLLQEAAETWGDDERFLFAAGNVYELPIADGVLDSLVMVRVMHHLADVAAALSQLSRVLHSESVAVIEYANKRNLKALLRWGIRRQAWSPLAKEPVEFVPLNYDFHPDWMTQQFKNAGFVSQDRWGVSHFRMPILKKLVPPQVLARLDSTLFHVGGRFPLAPSVFERLSVRDAVPARPDAILDVAQWFRCPECRVQQLHRVHEDVLQCKECGSSYARKNKVWDFKEKI